MQRQPPEVFCKTCDFIKKEALTQVFLCEFCEISKNTFFTEHLWETASANLSKRKTYHCQILVVTTALLAFSLLAVLKINKKVYTCYYNFTLLTYWKSYTYETEFRC